MLWFVVVVVVVVLVVMVIDATIRHQRTTQPMTVEL
jgi:hypothetical protein